MGNVVHGRGEQAAVRQLPETVPEHTENAPGPAPRPARQPDYQLPHQDATVV